MLYSSLFGSRSRRNVRNYWSREEAMTVGKVGMRVNKFIDSSLPLSPTDSSASCVTLLPRGTAAARERPVRKHAAMLMSVCHCGSALVCAILDPRCSVWKYGLFCHPHATHTRACCKCNSHFGKPCSGCAIGTIGAVAHIKIYSHCIQNSSHAFPTPSFAAFCS